MSSLEVKEKGIYFGQVDQFVEKMKNILTSQDEFWTLLGLGSSFTHSTT